MSQVSIIDIEGNNPQIPTEFVADIGSAIPIANTLEILGDTVPAGVLPVYTAGSGNTITTNVQISQAIASTNALNVGLSAYNSAQFSVDANGFVSLVGGADVAIDSIVVNNGSVNPVTPTAAGLVSVLGAHGLNTTGSTNTVTVNINNAITLGDLSAIAANSNALDCDTGDVNLDAGNLKLANANIALTQGIVSWTDGTRISNFGTDNLFIGITAGNGTLTVANSIDNIGIGKIALNALTTGNSNVGIGFQALKSTTTGNSNVAIGARSLQANITSIQNVAVGLGSFQNLNGGSNNVAIGTNAGVSLVSGFSNVLIGINSGSAYTGSEGSNIIIGASVSGTLGESGVTRIGGAQTACYIDGIDGVNVGSVANVVTESGDRLGTAVITAGSGISVTPSANTITISSTSGGFPWTDVSGAFSPLAQNGYFITATATGTPPASPAQGDTIQFYVDHSSQVLTIDAPGTQIIRFGTLVTSAGGTAVSTQRGDSCELVYRTSDTCWCAVDFVGTWIIS